MSDDIKAMILSMRSDVLDLRKQVMDLRDAIAKSGAVDVDADSEMKDPDNVTGDVDQENT
ncbi:hypothetical protein LC092_19325 [Stappia stellulata]|uniref:hypothetical protein n=1 Tax=Stappia TaxID=152161 RepID=UPI001CD28945|nr:hypothetical protein [Stappia stellulata]MCA1244603.1 hypothetical protein [Stappia stellulata]